MTLIEINEGESRDAATQAVAALIASQIRSKPEFTLGVEEYEWRNKSFRSFNCIAGSAHLWLMKAVERDGGRSLIVLGERDRKPVAQLHCGTCETEFDPKEIKGYKEGSNHTSDVIFASRSETSR
jgi:hypothetical protein